MLPSRVRDAFAAGLLQGICLFPAMHRYSMHDDRVDRASRTGGRPHPAGSVCPLRCVDGRREAKARPSVAVRHALFQSHRPAPDCAPLSLVNIVVPHFGAGYFREALMLCDLCPNVYLDTSSSNSWMRYEGLDLRDSVPAGSGGSGSVAAVVWDRILRSSRAAGTPPSSRLKARLCMNWAPRKRLRSRSSRPTWKD